MRTLRHAKTRCPQRRSRPSPSSSSQSLTLLLALVIIEQADMVETVCGAADKPDLLPLLIVALAVEKRRQQS